MLDNEESSTLIEVGPDSYSLKTIADCKDPNLKLDLTGGVGGFTNIRKIAKALYEDEHGGTTPRLGDACGSPTIDLIGASFNHSLGKYPMFRY